MKIPKQKFEHFSWNFNEPMGGGDKELKVATVDVESGDNMATLPASSKSHPLSEQDKVAALKEMEIKNVMPKPLERFNLTHIFLFILHSQLTL